MRKELELIEKIENYLLGKMSTEEKSAFEKEVNENPDLAKKVEAQSQIVEALKNMSIRGKVKKGKFKFKLKKLGLKLLIGGVVLGGLVAGYMAFKSDSIEKSNSLKVEQSNHEKVLEKLDGGNYESELENQIFIINNSKDTIIETEDGMVIYIPENAFDVEGNYELLVKEAITPEDIILGGLETFDDEGNLLETGGMFRIEGIKEDKLLKLREGKEFTVNVPTDNKKADMNLYDGVRDKDGKIQWTNPKPIENLLQTVDITTLDFYPPNYEDSLDSWRKSQEKKYRDSLYYSFSGECGDDESEIKSDLGDIIDEIDTSKSIDPSGKKPINGWENRELMEFKNPNYNITYTIYTDYTFKIKVPVREGDPNYNRINKVLTEGGAEIIVNNVVGSSNPPFHNFNYIFSVANVDRIKIFGNYPIRNFLANNTPSSVENSEQTEIVIPQKPLKGLDSLMANTFCKVLDPSKVKTIWNKNFNHTLLATKEFESRMPFIHKSCRNQVMDVYVNNLDQELWQCDLKAYSVTGNPAFKNFADKKDGKVKLNSKAHQKLQDYYSKKSKEFQKESSKIRNNYYQKQEQLRIEFQSAKSQNETANIVQKAQQLEKETQYMLRNIKQQNSGPVYSVTTTTGWKNIDQKVREKVFARESGSVTDGVNTVTLSFTSNTFTISEHSQYQRIKFYLLPQEIDAYIRLQANDGKWSYRTNDSMKYDVVVIAYDDKENVYSYIERKVRAGKDISLKKDNLKNIKKVLRKTDIKDEVDFISKDISELKRKRVFKEDEAFRAKIKDVIFCDCATESGPILKDASIENAEEEGLW